MIRKEFTMKRYIDANALYELAVSLENEAYEQISKINQTPLKEMSEKERYKWLQWTTILLERTAFKNDVASTPTAKVIRVKRGTWKEEYEGVICRYYCSNCGNAPLNDYDGDYGYLSKYCPFCGSKMSVKVENEK